MTWWALNRFNTFLTPSPRRVTSQHDGPQAGTTFHYELRNEASRPHVVQKSPDVLSMGRRCVEDGYSFHWPVGSSSPYFVTPNGDTVTLTVDHYIPFLGGHARTVPGGA